MCKENKQKKSDNFQQNPTVFSAAKSSENKTKNMTKDIEIRL